MITSFSPAAYTFAGADLAADDTIRKKSDRALHALHRTLCALCEHLSAWHAEEAGNDHATDTFRAQIFAKYQEAMTRRQEVSRELVRRFAPLP